MNTRKKKHLEQLVAYFIKKEKILTESEYLAEADTPIRPFHIKRTIGKWSRVVRFIEHAFPEEFEVLGGYNPVKKVMAISATVGDVAPVVVVKTESKVKPVGAVKPAVVKPAVVKPAAAGVSIPKK